jgi:hypothetical protein
MRRSGHCRILHLRQGRSYVVPILLPSSLSFLITYDKMHAAPHRHPCLSVDVNLQFGSSCRFASPGVPQLPAVLIIFSRSAGKIHHRCLIVSLSVRIIQHFPLLSIRNYLDLIYSIVTPRCFCNSMPTNRASLLLTQCAYLIEAPTDCSMHALQRCVGRRSRSCASAAFCMSPVHIAVSRPSRGANMVVAMKSSSSPTYCMNEE